MRIPLGLTIAAVAVSLMAPTSAGAATEFGDNCTGGETLEAPLTLFQISSPGSPLPASAPSAGVITTWKVNVIPFGGALPMMLKVLRPTGPNTALIVGDDYRDLLGGANAFPTRIPVQAGDRLGLYGPHEVGALYCEIGPPSQFGVYATGGTVGSTVDTVEIAGELRVPVVAVLEPDADNDGFGDETQDQCPQSAATQGPCPVVVVDSIPLVKKRKIVVVVATSSTTSVTVSGAAKLPRSTRRARSSAQAKLRKVTKLVQEGRLTRFALDFPAKLRSAVAGLARGKSLTVNLTARAANLVGPATTDRARVKLKG